MEAAARAASGMGEPQMNATSIKPEATRLLYKRGL